MILVYTPCMYSAEDLPDTVRSEAYQADDPAVVITGSLSKGTVMRKSSSELRSQDALVALPNKKARTGMPQANYTSQQEMLAGMANQFATMMMSYMGGNPMTGASGSSGSQGPDLPGFKLLQPPKGQGKQAPETDSQESSPPPPQSPATQRPVLQSPTQQQNPPEVTEKTFEMPDTSPPQGTQDARLMSAAAAAEAMETAVNNRTEEKQQPAGILKKPAAKAESTPKALNPKPKTYI